LQEGLDTPQLEGELICPSGGHTARQATDRGMRWALRETHRHRPGYDGHRFRYYLRPAGSADAVGRDFSHRWRNSLLALQFQVYRRL